MSTPYKWKMNITAVPLVTVARRLDFSSARFHWLPGDTLRTRLPVCVAQHGHGWQIKCRRRSSLDPGHVILHSVVSALNIEQILTMRDANMRAAAAVR